MNFLDKNHYEIIIIGGGVSGLYCATIAKYFGYKTCLVEENNFLGGQVMQLYPNKFIHDFPGEIEIKAKDVLNRIIKQTKSSKTEIFLNTKIIKITQENDYFNVCTEKKNYFAKFIILAIGIGNFLPIPLIVNDKIITNDKIIYSISEDESVYKNKKIVVLGGGDSAVDWSIHFVNQKISEKVWLIHRCEELRANPGNVLKLNKLKKIKQYLNYEVIKVNKNEIEIKNNNTGKPEIIQYDFLIVQYGQKNNLSNLEFFNLINKNEMNRFIVDVNQQTNLKSVFAIGDCVQYKSRSRTIVNGLAEGSKVIWFIYKEIQKPIKE